MMAIRKWAVALMAAGVLASLTACETKRAPSSLPEMSGGEEGGKAEGYVDVEELGAYGNDSGDDWEIVNEALRQGKSLYFGAGTYRFSKPLELDGQNIAGVSFGKTVLMYTGSDRQPLIRAQGVCGIRDMTLSFDKAVMTGQEKEGENVAIWLGGQKGLEPGSYVRNICLNQCGTAVYAPGNLENAASGVSFDTLEVQSFSYRGFDLRSPGRAGNTYTNIYCGAAYDNDTKALSDAVFALGGGEVAPQIHQLNVEHSNSRQPIIFSNLRDLTATAIHIEGMNIGEAGRGYVNIDHTSGVIRALTVYWSRVDQKGCSTVRLGDAADGGDALRFETFHMKGINDPNQGLHGNWPARGIAAGNADDFKMIARPAGSQNDYRVTVDSLVYFTFQNDRERYESFPCDDGTITFLKKGQLPAGGPTGLRPAVRLCAGYTTYYDTDLGKLLTWNGKSWS